MIVISSHNFDPEVESVCATALLVVSGFDDVQKAIAKLDPRLKIHCCIFVTFSSGSVTFAGG